MDDILVINKRSKPGETCKIIDNAPKATIESEKDGDLSFLDVLVIRNTSGTLKTRVYRKQTPGSSSEIPCEPPKKPQRVMHPNLNQDCQNSLQHRWTRKDEETYLLKMFEELISKYLRNMNCVRNEQRNKMKGNVKRNDHPQLHQNVSELTARLLQVIAVADGPS